MPPPGSGSKASKDYYKKAKKDYKKKTGFSTVGEKMRAEKSGSNKDNKASNEKKAYGMQDDITKEETATDKATVNVGLGTGGGRQTTDFINDLKDAYKSGLFTGGTKTKAFMDKYNLDASDIVKLRVGISQGLGTNVKTGTNVLEDLVGDLRGKGILTTSGPGAEFLQQRAGEIYEPGMKRSDSFLPYEDPQNIFEKGQNLFVKYNPLKNVMDGIFGSGPAMRASYFAREQGLEGDELNNFAAAVANDRNLYNQMMATPLMQRYELDEFRAEANKNMMANRSDPDPISGSQGGEGDDEDDDGNTDSGSGSTYTPAQQNYFTFFDPNLGRYRSGTYDEYLQYVTAKDGGIIQLQQGGTDEDPIANAPGGVLPQGRKTSLESLLTAREEIQNLDTPTDSEKEGVEMILSDIDKKISDLSDKSQEGIMMAIKDQPAKDLFMADNPDIGPVLREDLGPFKRIGDTLLNKLITEPLRRSDITTGSAPEFIDKAIDNFISAGIIPQYTTYEQLTDPFKEIVFAEAERIAANEFKKKYPSAQEMSMEGPIIEPQPAPYIMQEGQPEEFDKINPLFRGIPIQEQGVTDDILVADTQQNPTFDEFLMELYQNEMRMRDLKMKKDPYYKREQEFLERQRKGLPEVANVNTGGIIGLKQGGMNDMMQADSLMFNDPSDKGQWEYNV